MRLPDGLSPDELMAQLRRYVKPGGIVLFRSYTSRKFPFPGWVKIERGFFSKYTAYQKPGGLWQWLVYGLSLVGQRLGWGRSNPRDAFFKLDAIRLGRAV